MFILFSLTFLRMVINYRVRVLTYGNVLVEGTFVYAPSYLLIMNSPRWTYYLNGSQARSQDVIWARGGGGGKGSLSGGRN